MCDAPLNGLPAPGCACHKAVMTCYSGMRQGGAPERNAIDACCRVFSYHHPEACPTRSLLTVENWVYAGTRH